MPAHLSSRDRPKNSSHTDMLRFGRTTGLQVLLPALMLFATYVVIAFAGQASLTAYFSHFGEYSRSANDTHGSFAVILIPTSASILLPLFFAARHCARAFATKLPLFATVIFHLVALFQFNRPAKVITPFWDITDSTATITALVHKEIMWTNSVVILLHILALGSILFAAKPEAFLDPIIDQSPT